MCGEIGHERLTLNQNHQRPPSEPTSSMASVLMVFLLSKSSTINGANGVGVTYTRSDAVVVIIDERYLYRQFPRDISMREYCIYWILL